MSNYEKERDEAAEEFEKTCGDIDFEDLFKAGADWANARAKQEFKDRDIINKDLANHNADRTSKLEAIKKKVALMLAHNGTHSVKRTAQILDVIKHVAPNGTIIVATIDEWEKYKTLTKKVQGLVEALEECVDQNKDMNDGDIRDHWHKLAVKALAEFNRKEEK